MIDYHEFTHNQKYGVCSYDKYKALVNKIKIYFCSSSYGVEELCVTYAPVFTTIIRYSIGVWKFLEICSRLEKNYIQRYISFVTTSWRRCRI